LENKTNEVDVMLQNGVDFNITYFKPNIFQKKIYPEGRKFLMKPATLGTLFKVSQELNNIKGFEIKDTADDTMINLSVDAAIKYKDNFIKAIALAIVNENKEPSKKLVSFLNANLQPKEALALIALVLSQMGVQDFLGSMVLASQTNLMKVKTN